MSVLNLLGGSLSPLLLLSFLDIASTAVPFSLQLLYMYAFEDYCHFSSSPQCSFYFSLDSCSFPLLIMFSGSLAILVPTLSRVVPHFSLGVTQKTQHSAHDKTSLCLLSCNSLYISQRNAWNICDWPAL